MVQPCELARRDLRIKTITPLAFLTKTLHANILANAILSHTWEEKEEEVISRDMDEFSGLDKEGKREVSSGEQAPRDGYSTLE